MRIYHILIIVIGLGLLAACGSGSGGGSASGLSISCAEVAYEVDGACTAQKVASKPGTDVYTDGYVQAEAVDMWNSPSVVNSGIFNSGDMGISNFIVHELAARNNTAETVRVYVYIDSSTVSGCESLNAKSISSVFEVGSGMTNSIGSSGTNFELCATEGVSYDTVWIMNGAGMPLGHPPVGDPLNDEPLVKAVTRWNYVP